MNAPRQRSPSHVCSIHVDTWHDHARVAVTACCIGSPNRSCVALVLPCREPRVPGISVGATAIFFPLSGANPPTGVSISWGTSRQQRDATCVGFVSGYSPVALDDGVTRVGSAAEGGHFTSLFPGIQCHRQQLRCDMHFAPSHCPMDCSLLENVR